MLSHKEQQCSHISILSLTAQLLLILGFTKTKTEGHLHLPDVIFLQTLNHVLHCLLHASLLCLCHS